MPAMIVSEAIARLLPGVVGNSDSIESESFADPKGILECDQYTKPAVFEGLQAPTVLCSGNHKEIHDWRLVNGLQKTLEVRPDLLRNYPPPTGQELNVALLHEGMFDKTGRVLTTSLTLIDIHDISRSSRTFGAKYFYVAHPAAALRSLAETVRNHWRDGYGATYNPDRSEALSTMEIVRNLDEVISDITTRTGKAPKIIATSARGGDDRISFEKMRAILNVTPEPFLVLFGTGWGMADDLMARADYVLEPINGPTEFNHLSVRSACAIVLEKLVGRYGQ